MPIYQRPYTGEVDQQRMLALARQFPAGNLHVADLPYRLSSWAFDDPDNASLWVDERQQLVAWAVLQTPFWAIDYAIHPDVERALHRDILAWADGRAHQVVGTPSGRPAWFVNVFTGQTEYNRQGKAILTVNHWFDKITAKLSVREQIQWLSNGERGVTEHFTFTKDGSLVKYHKSLVHPPTDSYMEEIHLYDPRSQSLLRKEVKTYERHDLQAEVEITIYDTRGHQLEQKTVIEKRHLS